MANAKYKNYAELAAAFKSGELDKHHFIELDKGGMQADLRYWNPALSEELNEKRNQEVKKLFKPKYADHIDDLYVALGIPMQWC